MSKEQLFEKYDSMTEYEILNLYESLAEDTTVLYNIEDAESTKEEQKEFEILSEYIKIKGL